MHCNGHACILHGCDSFSETQVPLWRAGCTIVRERTLVPVSQAAEQLLHAPHSETWHGTGQGMGCSHARVSFSTGQAVPPFFAWRVTLRCRILVPFPHDVVQADHSPHSLTSHGNGHFSSMQLSQMAWSPPMYALLQHMEHTHPLSPSGAQSLGQRWVLQRWLSLSAGQAVPPNSAGSATVRLRYCDPPPHSREQLENADQLDTLHGLEQLLWSLHTRVSVKAPHGLPAPMALRTTLRLRFCSPPRHCLVQLSKGPHSDTTHDSLHIVLGHARVSFSTGQAVPPRLAANLMARARNCVPLVCVRVPLQAFEHLPAFPSQPQAPHGCTVQLRLQLFRTHTLQSSMWLMYSLQHVEHTLQPKAG